VPTTYMENNQKQYWASIEELSNDTEFIKQAQNEFPGYLSVKDKPNSKKVPSDGVSGSNRRDFLKLMGFGLAAATLASCNEAPIRKAIPFLNKPEEIDPGLPNYYASTYVDSAGGYSTVLVKTREGRPIKIEPNTLSRLTPIGTHTRAQASLLTLYDKERIMGPMKGGRYADWNQIDGEIRTQLQRASGQGGIRIVSSSIMSPTSRRVISEFISRYPGTQHIVYDANSVSGMIQANQATFGSAVVPFYDFSRANVIVSIGADFLGTWLYSHAQNYQYTRNRKLGRERKEMSRHYQFETNLSLTGANADYRTPIRPSQTGLVVAALYNQIARQTGGTPVNAPAVEIPNLAEAAADLLQARGRALVVSGSNDVNVQVMVNAINRLLGAYDNQIINLNRPLNLKQGNDNAMATFVQDVANGRVGAVIFYNANPVYDHPAGAALGQNLGNIGLSISMADRVDETAALCQYICPDHHYLEAWNDAEPIQGYYSLGQPTISPLFKTRAAQESLLNWAGAQQQDYYTYLRNTWRTTYFPLRSGELAGLNFEDF
jgi:MoCo/4Fe-4S cofactor protein with predicted Tat translocation signal